MTTEKRLIDANAADVESISCYYGSSCYVEDVQSWLDEQPTVDAVEVVFCDYCVKHGGCYTEDVFRLARIEKPYCCAGKKDGDGNG